MYALCKCNVPTPVVVFLLNLFFFMCNSSSFASFFFQFSSPLFIPFSRNYNFFLLARFSSALSYGVYMDSFKINICLGLLFVSLLFFFVLLIFNFFRSLCLSLSRTRCVQHFALVG